MLRHIIRLAAIAGIGATLAACHDDKGQASNPTTPTNPTNPANPSGKFSEFGNGFATAYAGTGATADPKEVTAADVAALSLTTKPSNVSS